MVGFPEKYCRVAASATDGDCGYVLLDTGSDGRPYFYGVNCYRMNGRWHESSSSNGGGWSGCGSADGELGMFAFWGEAPVGADAVRIGFDGKFRNVNVKNGAFLAMWWKLPCPSTSPCVVSYRIDGKWTPTPFGT